jgi:hypothetical protein
MRYRRNYVTVRKQEKRSWRWEGVCTRWLRKAHNTGLGPIATIGTMVWHKQHRTVPWATLSLPCTLHPVSFFVREGRGSRREQGRWTYTVPGIEHRETAICLEATPRSRTVCQAYSSDIRAFSAVAVTTESGILLIEGACSSAILPAVARLPVAIAVGGIGV